MAVRLSIVTAGACLADRGPKLHHQHEHMQAHRSLHVLHSLQGWRAGGLMSAEDAACNKVTELALNDVGVRPQPNSAMTHWLLSRFGCCTSGARL